LLSPALIALFVVRVGLLPEFLILAVLGTTVMVTMPVVVGIIVELLLPTTVTPAIKTAYELS
jgi:hypothetical protein